MKSQILILLAIFSCSGLIAQDNPDLQKLTPKRFIDKVDITAGPSLLYSHGQDYQTQIKTGKWGYSFGLGFSHRLTDRIDFVINSLYENKAIANNQTYVNDSSFSASTEVNFKINYLTINATPTFSFTRNRRLFLLAGPYYSIVLSTSGYYSGVMNKSGYNKSYAFWIPSELSHIPNDAGCTLGLGYSLPINRVKTSFTINMNYGLVKINDWGETSIKNMGFAILIRVSLRD